MCRGDPLPVLRVDVGEVDRRRRDRGVVLVERLGQRGLAAGVLGVGPQAAEQRGQGHVHRLAYGVGVLAELGGDLVDGQGGAQVVEVSHVLEP